MEKFLEKIRESKRVAIFSHENPDPDTVGSSIALCRILEAMGKRVELFCGSEVPENYAFLEYYVRYNTKPLTDFDLYIAVDVAESYMLGTYEEQFLSFDNTIRIDHHMLGSKFAKINKVYPFSACAVAIFDIAKKLNVQISSQTATDLYLGICGDTGVFRYNNTDSKTFKTCAALLEMGADFKLVYTEFFDKKTVSYVKSTAKALLGAKIDDKYGFVIMTLTKDDYKNFNLPENDGSGNLPNTYLNCGYNIGAILKEKSDGVHISFRSKFEYNVAEIAEKFGGGGHKNASGCKIDLPLDVATKMVEDEIRKYLKKYKKETTNEK